MDRFVNCIGAHRLRDASRIKIGLHKTGPFTSAILWESAALYSVDRFLFPSTDLVNTLQPTPELKKIEIPLISTFQCRSTERRLPRVAISNETSRKCTSVNRVCGSYASRQKRAAVLISNRLQHTYVISRISVFRYQRYSRIFTAQMTFYESSFSLWKQYFFDLSTESSIFIIGIRKHSPLLKYNRNVTE